MTARLPFTQAGLQRAIAAAQKAGLQVAGIRPDGTLLVHNWEGTVLDRGGAVHAPETSKWEDVEA